MFTRVVIPSQILLIYQHQYTTLLHSNFKLHLQLVFIIPNFLSPFLIDQEFKKRKEKRSVTKDQRFFYEL